MLQREVSDVDTNLVQLSRRCERANSRRDRMTDLFSSQFEQFSFDRGETCSVRRSNLSRESCPTFLDEMERRRVGPRLDKVFSDRILSNKKLATKWTIKWGTHGRLSQCTRERADERSASFGEIRHSSKRKQKRSLSRKEIYPKVEDGDGIGMNEIAIRLVMRREKVKRIVAGRDGRGFGGPGEFVLLERLKERCFQFVVLYQSILDEIQSFETIRQRFLCHS